MAIEHIRAPGIDQPRMNLGQLRGGVTDQGGFFLEIRAGAVVQRAELDPRGTVMLAVNMLRSQGIEIHLDPTRFRHEV